MKTKELKGRKYIISAAADGIGLSIAKKINEHGGIVYVTDVDEKKIKLINSQNKFKNTIFASKLDSTNPNEVKNYFKSFKKIDGIINNVGIAGPTNYLKNVTIKDWNQTIDTNLNSHFYFSKFAIPLLIKNNKGSIINISSTAGLFGFAQRSPYAASKWGIIGLTKTMAIELGKNKIRVNAICPGSVEGDRMNRVIKAKAKLIKSNPKKVKKELEYMVSLKSFVTKEDIASMALFLLSDKSKNISGQIMTVDGNTERMI